MQPPDSQTEAHAPLPPQTSRFQEKREVLLDAAARHFNAEGIKGATLGEIAAQVGLVTTSLTYYYRKKEDLATACFLRAIAAHDALALQAAADAPAPTVVARVSRFLALHAQMLADIETGVSPPLIGFADIRALPQAQAGTVFAAYTGMFRSLRALLNGPETDPLSRDDCNARAHLLLSAAHWLRAWVQHHAVDDYPRVAQRQANLLLHGLTAPGQAWPDNAILATLELDAVAAAALHPPRAPTDHAVDGATAEAFLRAATALVNEQGYRGASVDRISARLHVTKGAFYHHHETKHDLISACFERSFAVLGHTLRAAAQAPGPAWQRTCAAVATLVRFQLGPQGPLLRSTARSALPDEPQRAHVRRQQQQLTGLIASLLVDGLEDGSLRPHDPAIAAQLLASAINAAAELQRWVPGISPANATALYTRPALLGLLCSSANPTAS